MKEDLWLKNWFEHDYLQSRLVIVYFQTEAHFSPLVSRTNDGKYSHSQKITAVHCARAILILHTVISSTGCFVTVYFQMEAHSSPLSDV